LLRIGRRIGGDDVVFLANPLPESVGGTLRPNRSGGLEVWDPVTLRRHALPEVAGGYRLELPALGSIFVLPGGRAGDAQTVVEQIPLDDSWRLSLPDVLEAELPAGPRYWAEMGRGRSRRLPGADEEDRAVELGQAPPDGRTVLSFADVGELGRVRVNGIDSGVVWTAPWEIDVTTAPRPGHNTVEVDGANAWMNRLIAEANNPTGEIFAPVAAVYAADAPVQPSGPCGRVVLRRERADG
jgi:hypothetical protein